MQAAMNLTNKSQEAIERVNKWVDTHGGTVEHLSYEEVKKEVIPLLKK